MAESEMMGDSRELPPHDGMRVRWCATCRDVEVLKHGFGWRPAPREVLREVVRRTPPEAHDG